MTRYRRKVVETVDASPEENFGLPGYAYTNRDGVDVWRRKEAFEREYEPVLEEENERNEIRRRPRPEMDGAASAGGLCAVASDSSLVASLKRELRVYYEYLSSAEHGLEAAEASLKLADELGRGAGKICEWLKHTVPEWGPEVQKYLDRTEAALSAFLDSRKP